MTLPTKLSEMDSKISELVEFDGCFTGDCPHYKATECRTHLKAQIKDFILNLPEVKEPMTALESIVASHDEYIKQGGEGFLTYELIREARLALTQWHQFTNGTKDGGE